MAGQRLTDKTALEQQTGSGDLFMVVDVNDTTGSASGTSKKIDSKFVIQTDKFSLSNAEIQALHTTPKTLIGALSGYMITPFNVTMLCNHSSPDESSANNLLFGYNDSIDTSYWAYGRRFMNGISTSATFMYSAANTVAGACATTILNKPFEMWTSAALNGGFSMDVYVTYCYTKVL